MFRFLKYFYLLFLLSTCLACNSDSAYKPDNCCMPTTHLYCCCMDQEARYVIINNLGTPVLKRPITQLTCFGCEFGVPC